MNLLREKGHKDTKQNPENQERNEPRVMNPKRICICSIVAKINICTEYTGASQDNNYSLSH